MPKPTTKTEFLIDNTILGRQGAWQAATVRISAADVTAVGGKKTVPAGTFLGTANVGSTILGAGATAKPANDATTEGLLMNAVDVTDGDMEGSMLYMGTVALSRIPAPPDAAAKLPRITFVKD